MSGNAFFTPSKKGDNPGRGKVVLFADDPLYRGFWRGTAGLFNNAILMAPGR